MKKKLSEIAYFLGARLRKDADGDVIIEGLGNIEGTRATDLIFAVEPHMEEAKASNAAAVMLEEGVGNFPKPAIYVEDPRASFAKLLELFTPKLAIPEGVSDKAVIGSDVTLGRNVRILPLAVVDDHAVIGDNVTLYPHTYIGQYAKIGENTILYPSVTVREYCEIGRRCVIHAGASIGSDGFGFTTKDGKHTKVPQVGNVVIGDDVEIGAQDCIDRAAMGSTVIASGTKMDNLVHIGHNSKIGENCLVVAQVGISGSTTVGHNVTFGGQSATVGHIKVGANSVYGGRSGIISDMPEGFFGAGFPVQSHTSWLRMQAAMKQLPDMMKKIKKYVKLLDKLALPKK